MAGALTRSLLIECAGVTDEKRQAAVMAAWAVAWAGSKPIASLVDGSLADWIGVRATGALRCPPWCLSCSQSWNGREGRLDSSPGWQTQRNRRDITLRTRAGFADGPHETCQLTS
jgi:hypothetical protein